MGDLDEYKLFCGGLNLETKEDALADYFGDIGEVVECTVKKGKGFGFVTFRFFEDMMRCLKRSPYMIDGKQVEVRLAKPKEGGGPLMSSESNKVFVGGLSPEATADDIMSALAGYGITSANVVTLKDTEESRGFGFAFFDSAESARAIAAKRFVDILDRKAECKLAKPKDEMPNNPKPARRGQRQQGPPPPHHPHSDRYSGYGDYASQSAYPSYGGGHSYGYGSPYGHSGSYGYGSSGSYGYGSAGYPPSSYDMYPSSRSYMGGHSMRGPSMGEGYPHNPSAYGPSRYSAYRSSNVHPYSRR